MKINQSPHVDDFALIELLSPYISPTIIPVEYCIGDVYYSGLPNSFHPVKKKKILDNGALLLNIEGECNDLEIRIEYISYPDFPVIEWAAFITNKGAIPSPIISMLKVTPADFPGTNPVIRLGMGDGDVDAENVYKDYLEPLNGIKAVYPVGGLSCNGASPYMRLLFDEYGVNIAVGWPAQWRADYIRTAQGAALSVCQYRLNTKILPGETIRSPRLTLMAFTGSEIRGANLWRRWFIKYILVRENGKPIGPKIVCSDNPLRWLDDPRNLKYKEDPRFKNSEESELCSAEQQVEGIRNYLAAGIKPDIWWLDAGWYDCEYDWGRTGTWKPNPEQYPDGLHGIGEMCSNNDIKFLLWFEPERVMKGTELDIERPDWLLRRHGICWDSDRRRMNYRINQNYLLDFSQEECRIWITDRIDSIIKEARVNVYREDFNMNPLGYWIDNEAPDRIGALENAYVNGFLGMWKELISRNPGLIIDSCASGGRRNDLETLRTPAIPLHYTDHSYGNHPQKLGHARYMHQWLPYFKGSSQADWDDENGHYHYLYYNVRIAVDSGYARSDMRFRHYTSLGPMISAVCNYKNSDEVEIQKHLVNIVKRAGLIMLTGDYYPLSEFNRTEHEWYSDQFDANEEGFILFIRNACSEIDEFTVHPFLNDNETYCFENSETGEVFELSGSDADKGISMKLPKRSGVILFYRRKSKICQIS